MYAKKTEFQILNKKIQLWSEYQTPKIWIHLNSRRLVSSFWMVSRPSKFPNQTHLNHLNNGLVQYSDPHCTCKPWALLFDRSDIYQLFFNGIRWSLFWTNTSILIHVTEHTMGLQVICFVSFYRFFFGGIFTPSQNLWWPCL